MSFNTDAATDGILRVLALEVSSDDFATLDLALATKAGVLDGTNQYDARLLRVGSVRRGFGQNRVAAAGTCEVVVDNSDGELDSLALRASQAGLAQYRFRLKAFLVDPATAATSKAAGTNPTFTSKLLGEYVLTAWPTYDGAEVTLPLGDDVLGSLSQSVPLPTLADWEAIGSAATNPLYTGFGRPDVLDVEGSVPVPLAFGEDWVQAMPHLLPFGSVDAAFEGYMVVPICCTTDTSAVDANEITNVRIQFFDVEPGGADNAMRLLDLPKTVAAGTVGDPDITVWSVQRSGTITKHGVDFKVIYLLVRADLGCPNSLNNWLRGQRQPIGGQSPPHMAYGEGSCANELAGGYPLQAIYKFRDYGGNNADTPQYANLGSCVFGWFVKGVPLSAITQQTSAVQHPVDVVTDLVTNYVQHPLTVDSTMSARIKAGLPLAACALVVQPWTQRSGGLPPSLRQVVSLIAQSSDFDVFMNWSGEVSFAALLRDYTTATQYASLPIFTNEHFEDIRQWLPSEGERHSVYNRIFLHGGKPYPAEERGLPFEGPFDLPTGTTDINITVRVVEYVLEQGARPWRQQAENPLYWRTGLSGVARPMVRFVTDIRALQLDLGDFFRLTWARGTGVSAVFDDEVFQVEQITYAADGDQMELIAVWQDDTTTNNGYLLDNETLLVRSKGALTGSATTDGSANVQFGGTINLTTMGVTANDILVLRDSSQADDVFTLNCARRIDTVNSATDLDVLGGGLTAGTIVNADWYVVRGATTYPTSVSDPTNYPDGGDMYGKVTDASGQYSDASNGLKLLGG